MARNTVITFKVSENEKIEIQRKAGEMSLSDYLRAVALAEALDDLPAERTPDTEEFTKLVKQLEAQGRDAVEALLVATQRLRI